MLNFESLLGPRIRSGGHIFFYNFLLFHLEGSDPSMVFTIAIMRTLPYFLIVETRRLTLLSSSSSSDSFLSFFLWSQNNELALHWRFYMCQIAIFLKPLIVLSFNFLLKSSETNARFL